MKWLGVYKTLSASTWLRLWAFFQVNALLAAVLPRLLHVLRFCELGERVQMASHVVQQRRQAQGVTQSQHSIAMLAPMLFR